jgi:alanine or glycine:cation symporter, AGCS family
MEYFNSTLAEFRNQVWGPPLLVLLIGTGLYLTIILRGIQFTYLGYALKQVFASQKEDSKGDISHFQALMTSLAGAIGTGTIVGVSTALAVGGVGALFWMWVTAFVGMATKYAESLLAVKYRIVDKRGEMSGGPMHYIEYGLGWKWMAVLFAIFASVAAIGTGNLVQVNSIADAVSNVWHIDPWITGTALAVLTGLVLIGGVKSIGNLAGILVPIMALLYAFAGLYIIALNYDHIPAAFVRIFTSAFEGQAAVGGFLGSTVLMAIQMGVSRSVFSNEAGLGISSLAAAAAKTDSPGRQAMITMTGALISTVIVCTITGLVIAVTETLGVTDHTGTMVNGASMAIHAFNSAIYGGQYVVTIGLILFAFTTAIAWAYYGEKCCEYLFGEKSIIPYRVIYTLIIIPGAAINMESAWHVADITNGLMVIPNLIALIALSNVILEETRIFLKLANKEISMNKTIIQSL